MTKAELQRVRADNQAARAVLRRMMEEDLPILQFLTQAVVSMFTYVDALEEERDKFKRDAAEAKAEVRKLKPSKAKRRKR